MFEGVVMAPRRRQQPPRTLEEAVLADLKGLDASLPGVASSGEALAVLAMARDLDSAVDERLSSRVAAAREVREGLAALRARVPAKPAVDRLDDLARARERRQKRAAG